MTPQELKNSILQLAIHGKLVEQRPEEGSGKLLIKQIITDNDRLIKSGVIKKHKYSTEVSADEISFDIPESWGVVRFAEIGQLLDGEYKSGVGFPYLEAKFLRGKSEATMCSNGKYVTKGTKLILVDGENSGEVFDAICDGYMGSTFKVLHYTSLMDEQYILFFLLLHKTDYRNNKKGSAIPHLNKDLFFNMPLPIPPLAEQKRIVAKIEDLMPLIDRYDETYTKLEAFNKQFPQDMRKSILQMAIQGKLVPQDPSEGTGEQLYKQIQAEKARLIKEGKLKKEKPLAEITEDEVPFDVPKSWKWVRISDLCKSIADGDHQPPPQVPNGIPFLVISNVSGGSLDFSNTRFVPSDYFKSLSPERIAKKGDILFTVTGSYGIPVKVDRDTSFCFQRHMALLKLMLEWDYLFYALKSPVIKNQCDATATGTAQKTVGLNALRTMILPLPPLAEQKRIVAKLEELLPLCDKLKNAL